MLNDLLAALGTLRWAETAAVLTGLAYLWLIMRQDARGWLFGIVSAACWAYAAAVYFRLYIDALLQVYYIGMGAYGYWAWRQGKGEDKKLPIRALRWFQHLLIIGSGLALTYLFGYLFATYTTAAATYLDAFTTVFSLVATVLVARKYIDNWPYWLCIDAVYIHLYASRGGYLFALLFVLYLIMVLLGWARWRQAFFEQKSEPQHP